MNFRDLPDRLARARERVAAGQARGGWTHPVTIVAVTKGWGPEAVRAAVDAGLTDVGENRVQEALPKQDATAGLPVTWHLVGHLQTNKARQVVSRFGLIHSVDSLRLGDALARAVLQRDGGRPLSVLLQVNQAGEEQKFGCAPSDAAAIARHLQGLPELALVGLMAMAPYTDDVATQRRVFGGVRALRDRLQEEGLVLPELSMGMSGDFEIAAEEGATLLRLGTVLFGERPT